VRSDIVDVMLSGHDDHQSGWMEMEVAIIRRVDDDEEEAEAAAAEEPVAAAAVSLQ
jgi:hypothetical protein